MSCLRFLSYVTPFSRRSSVHTACPCVTKSKFHIPTETGPKKEKMTHRVQTFTKESDRNSEQCGPAWLPMNQMITRVRTEGDMPVAIGAHCRDLMNF